MKRFLILLAVLTLATAALAAPASAGGKAQQNGPMSRYVVVFNGSSVDAAAIEAAGGVLVDDLEGVGVAIATSANPDFRADVEDQPRVRVAGNEYAFALPDVTAIVPKTESLESGPTPADVYYDLYQWDIRRVHADQAWEITSGSHDTVVAVIDTGVAWNHPDLAPNVVYTACYWTSTDPCLDYPWAHWHGTHVAGTIAAAFDHGAAVGVGPDLGIASYNVFELYDDPDEGPVPVAFDGPIWDAMIDAADRGYDVINMSLGGYVIKPASQGDVAEWVAWNRVADYVTRRGVTIVASSGNGDVNLNGPVDHVPSDVPGVISVGATGIGPDPIYPQEGAYDVRAFYSNYGASVMLAAPGGDLGPEGTPYPFPAALYLVFSTLVYPDPGCAATASCPVGYAWAGGTSMASPHVSGVAGLVKDANPRLSPRQVAKILKQTAEPLGNRQVFGHGMVDAYAALNK